MKPNFALSLSFEGIRLLHRSGTGWTPVGEVGLDSPDLGGELAVLRKTALALDPAGLRSKLILPNEQIRYLALDTTRASEDEIRAALGDATPYRLDELVWDVVRGGGRTYIAAVARETLDEAETFALDHRFGPVSFVAVPEEFTFIGEPFFGQTKVAAMLLPGGETVERDAVAVAVKPGAGGQRPAVAVAADAMPGADGTAGVPAAAAPAPEPVAVAKGAEAPAPGEAAPEAEAPVAEAEAPVAEDVAAARTDAGPAGAEEKVPAISAQTLAARLTASAEPAVPVEAVAPEVPVVADALATGNEPEEVKAADVPPPEAGGPGGAEPAEPEADPPIVFASRSRPQPQPAAAPAVTAAALPAEADDSPPEPVFGRRAPPPLAAPPAAAATAGPVLRAAPAVGPASPAAASIGPARSGREAGPGAAGAAPPLAADDAAGRSRVVPFAPPRAAAAPAPAPDPGARIAPFPQRPKPAATTPSAGSPGRVGAAPAGGRSRYRLLILTALLLLGLLIVALWLGRTDNVVSRFFGGGSGATELAAVEPVAVPLNPSAPDPATGAAAAPPATEAMAEGGELVPAASDPVAPGESATLPDAGATAAAAAMVAEAIAGAQTAADAATAEAAEPMPATLPEGEIALVTPEEAERFYAATGVWLRAPRLPVMPGSEDLAALVLPVADAPVAARAGARLPAGSPDAGLVAQANPPPAGTRLPRDARGFILATPEGTLTPGGMLIFAGAPTVVPPTRPGTAAPVPAEATEGGTALPPGQPMTEPPAVRPRARSASFAATLPPEAIVELAADAATDAAAGAEGVAPGGVTLAGLSPPSRPADAAAATLAAAPLPAYDGRRPAARPEGLVPEGATSAPIEVAPEAADPEAALAQTLASIVEGAGDPLATATPRAVAVVRRPDVRPDNFARVVDRQTTRLARATESAREQSAGASLGTPEEAAESQAEEVEVAAAAPAGNVPRSVAEAATMENVMALREINLIGVYGTPNNRRALVRLGNGRYVRVTVGDTLDGGQVRAISDTALNYVRRGRTITLEIPGN